MIDKSIINIINKHIPNYCQEIKQTKWNKHKWKGLTLMKDPMTLSIYLQLIQNLKPKTIVEFGTYEGGSALWMYDMCKALNLETKVVTVDIVKVKSPHKNIEFLCRDVYHFKIKDLKNFKSPMLVIEDCHQNTLNLLNMFGSIMKKGDFFIIEDTIDFTKYKLLDKVNQKIFKNNKYYSDFWGYNNSWNYDSYLEFIAK